MPEERCPYCGQVDQPKIDTMRAALRDHEVLALRAVRRWTQVTGGQRPTTGGVAREMGYSYRIAYRALRRLETRHLVHRPEGPRSGWSIPRTRRTEVHALLDESEEQLAA